MAKQTYGTYVNPNEVEWFAADDHPAIVYPLRFAPVDEYQSEAIEALHQLCETGETGCPCLIK